MIRNFLAITIIFLTSCTHDGIFPNSEYKSLTENTFNSKKIEYGEDSPIFSIFNKELTTNEYQSLQFLYAYAPNSDMNVDHDLMLNHVRTSLKAREEMAWGDSISNEMFLHFVLPIRVNNEPLDSFRSQYYETLKARVANMSMQQAALEVNYWCQENVIYGSSDARTSSPLQSIKSGFGRCGEESVFTVAALRAIGLPARQVYAPRWSHSDDNHAWVEVYTGDGWHYMGACEPEAKLDKGWFSSVATRSMLMVTKVFGDYYGSEEIISKNATFTDINLTSNYAPTKEAVIRVMSAGGKVNIPFADVEFKVFNYGQFHTIASKKSDADGLVSLTMGVGDILVWANNGEMFGFSKLAADNSDTTAIRLSLNKDRRFTYLFNMSAPSESEPKQVIISPEMEEINKQRISEGNKIRNSYINTFPDSSAIVTLAKQMNINNTKAHFIITSSRGNSSEILAFLNSVEKSKLPLAVEYLEMLPVKDLRDISAATLSDHFTNALEYENKFDKETFLNYLLNPRVLTERVTAYRTKFSKETQGRDLKEIIELVSKVEANIKFYLDGIITSPEDVLTLGISDSRSRNTLLVALCRSAGIPARIEVMSEKVQVYNTATKKWENIDYINKQSVAPDYGYLNLANSSKDVVKDPIYYTHFTLSKIKNHTNSTVNMPRNKNVDMGGGAKYSALFSKPIELEEGFYVATTGNRLENGQVYTSIESFNINSNEQTDVNLKVRTENVQANTSFSLDKFDILILLQEVESGLTKPINKILTKKDTRHHIFALIDPGTEPTNHALRGLKAIESEINAWGGDLVVAVKDKETWDAFNKNEFGKLPITTYAIDVEGHLEKFCRLNGYPKERLPCFFIINQDDEIVYVVNGYQTNLSEIIKRFLK